jgi:S1-C subfamily serine protease
MSGVYIMEVNERGGAKDAGIKEDDILLSVNNISVNSNSQLVGVVSQYRPGDKVKVKILRNGNILVKEVTLKNLEGTEELHKDSDSFYNEVLGIKAQALSASLKSELGINHGLKVVEVKDGVFKQKGITNDFVILSVNYQKVSSENDLRKALNNDRNGKIRIEGTNSTGTYNIIFEFYR